jgi:hypothetical protein
MKWSKNIPYYVTAWVWDPTSIWSNFFAHCFILLKMGEESDCKMMLEFSYPIFNTYCIIVEKIVVVDYDPALDA